MSGTKIFMSTINLLNSMVDQEQESGQDGIRITLSKPAVNSSINHVTLHSYLFHFRINYHFCFSIDFLDMTCGYKIVCPLDYGVTHTLHNLITVIAILIHSLTFKGRK